MADSALIPLFQGSLDQIKELQALLDERGLTCEPMAPPGGARNS